MSFSRLALASVFLFSLAAFSADDSDTVDSTAAVNADATTQTQRIKNNTAANPGFDSQAYKDLSTSYTTLNSDCTKLQSQVDQMAKKLSQAHEQDQRHRGWSLYGAITDTVPQSAPADKEAIDRYKGDLDNLNAQLAAKKAALHEAHVQLWSANVTIENATTSKNASLDAVKSAQEKTIKQINSEMGSLKAYLNRENAWNQLRENYSDLEIKTLKVSDVLHQIEARYDKTMMGAYVASKIEKLMTSDAFCHVAKACDGATQKNTYKINKSDMDQIFTGSPGYLPPAENKTAAPSSSQAK